MPISLTETLDNVEQWSDLIRSSHLSASLQQASPVTQASFSIDSSSLDETSFNVDQRIRPDAPQTITYKAPADIQPTMGSIRTTASALGGEEPAQETPVNIVQLRQPAPKDSSTSDVVEQQATSITQPSAFTEMSILEETSFSIDQIHRPDTPQTVHYKAPAGIQPSTGSIHTSASALSAEEPAGETPVHISQLRQPAAADLPVSDITEQQTSLITQPSISTDIPILEDTSILLDQVVRPDSPQTIHYKAPADIQPSTGSIRTTASALGEEELAQETPVHITQLRQPTAKDLPASDVSEQQATSVTQLSASTDTSVLEETSLNVGQVVHPDAPQTIHYKAPADIQPSTGSIRTTASALGEEELAQETPIHLTQLRQPTAKDLPISDAGQQQTRSITQLSAATDTSVLEETSLNVDQVFHPDAPQTIHYKAPADIQSSTGSIRTTASALGEEELAQETSIHITQLRQPTATDLPTSDVSEQQATSVTQLSAATDILILEETSLNVDQVIHPDTPQTVQYKAPADIQPSTGSIFTTASALSSEEPAEETPVNVTHLLQPTSKDVRPSEAIEQHATSVTQLTPGIDAPAIEEASLNIDRIHRPDAPQPIQYKAPADIQPSTGSIRTTASALGEEELAQETPIHVTQLRQPTATDLPSADVGEQQAKSITQLNTATDVSALEEASLNVNQLRQATATDLPDDTRQRASSISQPSVAIEAPSIEETPLNANQVHLAQTPQPYEYKAPPDIKESAANLRSTPSVLATEDQEEFMPATAQAFQQQKGHKAQRPSVISDLSFAPAEDDLSEMPYEIQVQQQRSLKLPQELVESVLSISESDEQMELVETTEDYQLVTDLKKSGEEQVKAVEEDKSISRESSMNVDEVIETIHLEDELLEAKHPFVADISVPVDESTPSAATGPMNILPTIEELPQKRSEEITVQLNQLETVPSDQRVEELPSVVNVEIQSLLQQLDQVSSIQPAPIDIPTIEELESFVTVDKDSPTLKLQTTEEPFEILTGEIVDYIDISSAMTISNEPIPEAIIVTDETKSTKTTHQIDGTYFQLGCSFIIILRIFFFLNNSKKTGEKLIFYI